MCRYSHLRFCSRKSPSSYLQVSTLVSEYSPRGTSPNFAVTAKLRELWVIPIFFIVTTLVSMIVAYFLSIVLRLKKSQRYGRSIHSNPDLELTPQLRAFAIAASMFMNSNSLPIALMQSLVVTVPGLKWDEDDNSDAMVGRALTYLVLYSTLGMVVRLTLFSRGVCTPFIVIHRSDGVTGSACCPKQIQKQ